jgi:OmcA/MtrC family decaheme c-type cytochrome
VSSENSRRIPKAAAIAFRLAIVTLFALTLTGAGRTTKEIYGRNAKAAYADPQLVSFVSPGLVFKVNSASIAADGTMTAVFTVTSTAGLGLDTAGITTPGALSVSLLMSYIPNNSEQYVPYIMGTITGAAGTFPRPSSESATATTSPGKLTVLGNGQYQYVFGAKAPANFDQSATHTLGIYGSRTLTPFNMPNEYASVTYSWVPNGGKVSKVRNVVSTQACDNCHDQLSFHGGSRRAVEVCILCHTQNMIDSTTGQSIDFKVFIHKIHAGSSLPSVAAGGTYKVGSVDASTVVYPADVRRCETCHDPKTATQANLYNTNPTAEACGSCHDDVNFASGVNHAGGPQPDNSMCSQCHIPQGELEFDASIKGAHTIPTDSSYLTGLVVNLNKVTNSSAGQKPTVTLNLQDKNGNGIGFPTGGSLSLTMAGPTTDYGYTSFGSDVTTQGYVTESVPASACDASGNCSYTFTHAVPAGAKGTFAIGVEARRSETILPGTTSSQSVQYGANNKVVYFSVDGSPVQNRRAVVQTSNCNRCHVELSLHGGLRNNTEYCVMCHNPSMSDFPTRPQATDPAQKNMPNQGIAFDLLVHRVHTGDNLPAMGRSYTIVGFGGSINDFTDVRYPAMSPNGRTQDTRNCLMCHNTDPTSGSTAYNLPLGKNAVTDPQGPINPDPAISAACTGCHAQLSTASHAMANTTAVGESCQACHAAGAQGFNTVGLDYGVDKVHAQY